jgi:hypothetical protein
MSGGTTLKLKIQITNETYHVSDWAAMDGYSFLMILELWTYQSDWCSNAAGVLSANMEQPDCNCVSTRDQRLLQGF